MITWLKQIYNNQKQRNIAILIILSLILILTIIIQILNMEKKLPEGALRVVVCKECDNVSVKRIKDINDKLDKRNICKKCQGKLEIAWKCNDCQFEYPALKMDKILKKLGKTMDKFQAVVESRRCPNCRSLSAHPISIDEFNKK
jgi:rubredoxin